MGTFIKLLRSKLDTIAISFQQLKHNIVASKLKKKYPGLRVFDESEQGYYSQMGQDKIIFTSFFSEKKEGVYCDVGGNHPTHFNNTKYFEEMGWNGYVFEPLPNMKPLWEEMRNTVFFPYAASNSDGEATLSIPETEENHADMYSQIEMVSEKKHKDNIKDIIVPTRSIKSVFKKNNHQP
jgi:FkbM family methyltransferase